ncbi:hypothetical protein BJ684DRAFT_16079 [Piptocephalis cylindrospora]|uniref:RRM domain-containing protein n=1 Tax=Piptocephalis cylindrospora TaxID=1907219 RepID=A0A4P9Y3M3_9FUNG|nr:hypothetical protein BJ684DRAFT_16079 [Piptocephalis cylindrospora]|eukprot:RKP13526.1 hypothetical protein BJ684DRAFT_16079 [Piptocephalis cylindrospora]
MRDGDMAGGASCVGGHSEMRRVLAGCVRGIGAYRDDLVVMFPTSVLSSLKKDQAPSYHVYDGSLTIHLACLPERVYMPELVEYISSRAYGVHAVIVYASRVSDRPVKTSFAKVVFDSPEAMQAGLTSLQNGVCGGQWWTCKPHLYSSKLHTRHYHIQRWPRPRRGASHSSNISNGNITKSGNIRSYGPNLYTFEAGGVEENDRTPPDQDESIGHGSSMTFQTTDSTNPSAYWPQQPRLQHPPPPSVHVGPSFLHAHHTSQPPSPSLQYPPSTQSRDEPEGVGGPSFVGAARRHVSLDSERMESGRQEHPADEGDGGPNLPAPRDTEAGIFTRIGGPANDQFLINPASPRTLMYDAPPVKRAKYRDSSSPDRAATSPNISFIRSNGAQHGQEVQDVSAPSMISPSVKSSPSGTPAPASSSSNVSARDDDIMILDGPNPSFSFLQAGRHQSVAQEVNPEVTFIGKAAKSKDSREETRTQELKPQKGAKVGGSKAPSTTTATDVQDGEVISLATMPKEAIPGGKKGGNIDTGSIGVSSSEEPARKSSQSFIKVPISNPSSSLAEGSIRVSPSPSVNSSIDESPRPSPKASVGVSSQSSAEKSAESFSPPTKRPASAHSLSTLAKDPVNTSSSPTLVKDSADVCSQPSISTAFTVVNYSASTLEEESEKETSTALAPKAKRARSPPPSLPSSVPTEINFQVNETLRSVSSLPKGKHHDLFSQYIGHLTFKRVFFAGFRPVMPKKALNTIFRPFGTIQRLVKDTINWEKTSLPPGQGYVDYTHADDAKAAVIALHWQSIDGKRLRVLPFGNLRAYLFGVGTPGPIAHACQLKVGISQVKASTTAKCEDLSEFHKMDERAVLLMANEMLEASKGGFLDSVAKANQEPGSAVLKAKHGEMLSTRNGVVGTPLSSQANSSPVALSTSSATTTPESTKTKRVKTALATTKGKPDSSTTMTKSALPISSPLVAAAVAPASKETQAKKKVASTVSGAETAAPHTTESSPPMASATSGPPAPPTTTASALSGSTSVSTIPTETVYVIEPVESNKPVEKVARVKYEPFYGKMERPTTTTPGSRRCPIDVDVEEEQEKRSMNEDEEEEQGQGKVAKSVEKKRDDEAMELGGMEDITTADEDAVMKDGEKSRGTSLELDLPLGPSNWTNPKGPTDVRAAKLLPGGGRRVSPASSPDLNDLSDSEMNAGNGGVEEEGVLRRNGLLTFFPTLKSAAVEPRVEEPASWGTHDNEPTDPRSFNGTSSGIESMRLTDSARSSMKKDSGTILSTTLSSPQGSSSTHSPGQMTSSGDEDRGAGRKRPSFDADGMMRTYQEILQKTMYPPGDRVEEPARDPRPSLARPDGAHKNLGPSVLTGDEREDLEFYRTFFRMWQANHAFLGAMSQAWNDRKRGKGDHVGMEEEE